MKSEKLLSRADRELTLALKELFEMTLRNQISVLAGIVAVCIATSSTHAQNLKRLRGSITIDGSSTVYPITERIAEEFRKQAPNVKISVGVSGTGGGFKRFAANETDISDASRPIKKSEAKLCTDAKIEFIEIPVAYDGLTIVLNKGNYWVENLTVKDLKKIFLSEDPANTWAEVRPEWPDREIKIFAPGTDSGTFDYFKEVVAGKTGSIRSDISVSEDDNVLVRGVAGEESSIGFFGAAYFFENKDKLKAAPIINDKGEAITPNPESIEDGTYNPFSRPLFIYVKTSAAKKRHVKGFIDFYLKNAAKAAQGVGYVGLPPFMYERAQKAFKTQRTGTQFLDEQGEPKHGPASEIYK